MMWKETFSKARADSNSIKHVLLRLHCTSGLKNRVGLVEKGKEERLLPQKTVIGHRKNKTKKIFQNEINTIKFGFQFYFQIPPHLPLFLLNIYFRAKNIIK